MRKETEISSCILEKWIHDNLDHPYPNKHEKEYLAKQTKLPMVELESLLTYLRQRKLKNIMRQRSGFVEAGKKRETEQEKNVQQLFEPRQEPKKFVMPDDDSKYALTKVTSLSCNNNILGPPKNIPSRSQLINGCKEGKSNAGSIDAVKNMDTENSRSRRHEANTTITDIMQAKIVNSFQSYQQVRNQFYSRDYPNAPLGQIWCSSPSRCWPRLDRGGSLMGRKWVWDEGYFADELENHQQNFKEKRMQNRSPTCENITSCRAYCTCGSQGRETDKVEVGRSRRNTGVSINIAQVLNELASRKLNPHTLIRCESYSLGPEYSRIPHLLNESTKTDPLVGLVREKGGRSQVQPFSVRVSPDAAFLADLHAHLADCEIIGLLGGRWIQEEKCVYIQAAFPCKAADSGSTDVEMDPVSQVMVRNAISSHGMDVVGWYHSHPLFRPDPSVTDIENQGNYQRLFVAKGDTVDFEGNKHDDCTPFVGLIIGTWDARNPSAKSIMRWFHVTPKETGNVKSIKNRISKSNANVDFSFSGGAAKERVLYPMKLDVIHRCFRKEGMIPKDITRKQLIFSGLKYREQTHYDTLRELRKRRQGEIIIWENRKKQESRNRQYMCKPIAQATIESKENDAGCNGDENGSSLQLSEIPGNCPDSPHVPGCESEKNVSITKFKKARREENDPQKGSDGIVKLCMPPNSYKAFIYSMHLSNETLDLVHRNNKRTHCSMTVKPKFVQDADAYILSDFFPSNPEKYDDNSNANNVPTNCSQIDNSNQPKLTSMEKINDQKVGPLFFSSDEFHVLNGNIELKNDEEKAKIIWNAVEREQCNHSFSNNSESSTNVTNAQQYCPPSSQEIVTMLLQLYLVSIYEMDINENDEHGSYEEKDAPEEQSKISSFFFDDATLVHSVDALFSHYAFSKKRVDFNDNWIRSGTHLSGSVTSTDGMIGANPDKQDKMCKDKICRMKKGQKLCISLLQWAQKMQLSGALSGSNYMNIVVEEKNSPMGMETNDVRGDFKSGANVCNASFHESHPKIDKHQNIFDNKSNSEKIVASIVGNQINFPSWDNESYPENSTTYVDSKGNVFFRKENPYQFNLENMYVKFTAEIMRLLAARWREASLEVKRPARKGRPSKKNRDLCLTPSSLNNSK